MEARINIIKRNVLVLNQTYEPLHICDVKRAIVLILEEKATLVKSFDHQVLRTVCEHFEIPSVIRIHKYVKVGRWEAVLNKPNIFRRDNFTCQYCGAQNVPLTIDHIVPKVHGGPDSWTNLVTACIACNNKKGNRNLVESGMVLRNKPIKPHKIHTLQRFAESPINEWRPYLFLD
ncbi:MAG: HNH endonuclease [Candidatus Marinimicrobia bacterium]|jgi:5-methylcytosine-specific restriction endonuclease McrA|nr:HNH endonuclease [Candidatus Neomarinimicrobiota bacterium]MCK9559084.1 HNH endonuclease [Candidatus Neomarinimicrobiota bacterium]MDD5230799.1 HNH endonuclease [Candidatus Neomarinimicrobiota bacterium]MDD5540269.1 HNH endonuclease [Candidatus Neomarinimicrobiota bacterium]